jgi:Fe-S-cluster containining protein
VSALTGFLCKKCGKCCRSIRGNLLYQELDDGTGICIFLEKETNLCLIYENRPLKCRIKEAYEIFFKDSMSEEKYYSLNLEACKILNEE